MRENGTICPFVFPKFYSFFRVKMGIFLKNVVFLECTTIERASMGVEQDTVSLGSTHKQPKCLQNNGKPTRP